eukprot:TRINITY_DN4124_c0_g2_i3.p1 TRINITY_DN4124_c0_g2~~TRINITY_DN4124_c0_g2_i3.p1  ORF type:complete len:269 (-),score=49.75 TRINITY_DN4124_c0_g2_i3:726-1532(-)
MTSNHFAAVNPSSWFLMDSKDSKRGGTAPHFEARPSGSAAIKPNFGGVKAGQRETRGEVKVLKINHAEPPERRMSSSDTISLHDDDLDSGEATPPKRGGRDADEGESILVESLFHEDRPKAPATRDQGRDVLPVEELMNELANVQRPCSSYSMLRANKQTKKLNVGKLFDEERGARLRAAEEDQGEERVDNAPKQRQTTTRGKDKGNVPILHGAGGGPIRASHTAMMRPPSRHKTPTKGIFKVFLMNLHQLSVSKCLQIDTLRTTSSQ